MHDLAARTGASPQWRLCALETVARHSGQRRVITQAETTLAIAMRWMDQVMRGVAEFFDSRECVRAANLAFVLGLTSAHSVAPTFDQGDPRD